MSQFTTVRAQENIAAGAKGGFIGLGYFLYFYLKNVIGWDLENFVTLVDWEYFVEGSILAYAGTGGVAGWYRDQQAPWKTVEEGPFKAPDKPVERITHRIEPDIDQEFDLVLIDEWAFSAASEKKLSEAHPDLVKVARRALEISPVDFGIVSASRTIEEQRQKVASGASKTLKSRHLEKPYAMAVDFACYLDGKITWKTDPYYLQVTDAFVLASGELGLDITTGVSFGPIFNDGLDAGHIELSKYAYPYKDPES